MRINPPVTTYMRYYALLGRSSAYKSLGGISKRGCVSWARSYLNRQVTLGSRRSDSKRLFNKAAQHIVARSWVESSE
jgi:hypothetical protein